MTGITETEVQLSASAVRQEVARDLWNVKGWLNELGGSAVSFVIRAAIAALVFFVIAKLLGHFLKLMEKSMIRRGVEHSVRTFILSILRFLILGFVLISIIVRLNIVEGSTIAALIASAGVGISLAMQGVLSNFAGGLLLLILRPFRTGDYIRIESENLEGTVRKIEMYYTTIEKLDLSVTVIPNSTLTNHAVLNYSRSPDRILEMKTAVAYGESLDRVKAVLSGILDEEKRISPHDRSIFVDSLGDNSVVMGFRVHVKNPDYWAVKWELNETITKQFSREGIAVPCGRLDVQIHQS